MSAIEPILNAYEEGRAALLLTGRSLYDLVVDGEGKLRPLIEVLRRSVYDRHGMAMLAYSRASGLDWDAPRLKPADRAAIEKTFRSHGLLDIPQDEHEVVRIIRGVSSMTRQSHEDLRWADGRGMRFCVVFEFAEHLTPGALTNGTQTDTQLIAIELAHITVQSLALRHSGNLVLFQGRHGLLDELVASALHTIRVTQPDETEKKTFLTAALRIYEKARFEDGLSAGTVAHLTANTPNRSVEALVRASHRTGLPVSARRLTEQRSRDVAELSEGTLTVLDTRRVQGVDLSGLNMATPIRVLDRYADGLLRNDRFVPPNVLLVGPPGAGKTDLSIRVASRSRIAAYQLNSPKSGIVGETERKARLQQTILTECAPAIGWVDEITEAMPMERSDFDGDSGASRAVMAALLTALSDGTRSGLSLILATTNCPWRIGDAMRSRFAILPVLHPLESDFPAIVTAIAHRLVPDAVLDPTNGKVREASSLFYRKGANPRHVRAALSNALLIHGKLTEDTLLFAAHDLTEATDFASTIYADLWAIRSCSSKSFLPWNGNVAAYPFPPRLRGIVGSDGEIREEELTKRLEEYKSRANV